MTTPPFMLPLLLLLLLSCFESSTFAEPAEQKIGVFEKGPTIDVQIGIEEASASSQEQDDAESREKSESWRGACGEQHPNVDWPWLKNCQSTARAAALFIQGDVLVNTDPYYAFQKALPCSCPACPSGSQAHFGPSSASGFRPDELAAGSQVVADLTCWNVNDTCVETVDGRRWRGFGPAADSYLYITVFVECPERSSEQHDDDENDGNGAKKTCVARAILDGVWNRKTTATGSSLSSETPLIQRHFGLREVDGPATLRASDNYDEKEFNFLPRHLYNYPTIRGIGCNGCREPLGFCDPHFPRPVNRQAKFFVNAEREIKRRKGF